MRTSLLATGSLLTLVLAACSGSGMTGNRDGGDGMVTGDSNNTGDATPSDTPAADAPMTDAPTDSSSCTDNDHDGVTTCAGDCNDNDPLAATGLSEICGDAIDNDCDGMTDEGCTGGVGTYVSALTGSDSNPGTRSSPVQTIHQGIANAMTLGGTQSVIVAEGDYAEKVTMVEGVNLLGGYQCATGSCTWARDPAMHAANIRNTDFEGVLIPATVTRATALDGFHVIGQSGPGVTPGSSAITIAGTPTVRGNTIVGGDVNGGGFGADRSMGVRIRPNSDPNGSLIEGNDIRGGTSSNSTVALTFDWMGASGATAGATIRGNVLRGGTGQHTAGLAAWSSATGTLVTNNDIFSGTSTNGTSHGIEVGGRLIIDGNRIDADPARAGACTGPTNWCAGISSESSTSTITNNVIVGPQGPRSAAVVLGEFEVPAGGIVLNGNTLDGGGSGPGAAQTRSAALVVTIGPCTTCGFHGVVGHVRNNILLGGNNTARYGVLEDPAAMRQMHPEILENNLFYFAPASGRTDVLYRQMGSTGTPTDLTMLSAINALPSMPMASANVQGDPLLDATRHLMTGSPAIDVGTAMEAPMNDFEGDTRPRGAGIDIGADER